MSTRKPLDEKCDGGIWCPVEGHVSTRQSGSNRWHTSHIPLTRGQEKTLRERRAAERDPHGLRKVPSQALIAELAKRGALIQQTSENLLETSMPPRPTNFYRRWVEPTWEDYTHEKTGEVAPL